MQVTILLLLPFALSDLIPLELLQILVEVERMKSSDKATGRSCNMECPMPLRKPS